MFKTVVLLYIFVETMIHLLYELYEEIYRKKQNLFGIEISSDIIHMFTVTVDQFNVPLLN